MKKQEIENQMQSMIGKVYSYNKVEHRVIRYELSEAKLKITTDVSDVVIFTSDIDEVLPLFKQVESDDTGGSLHLLSKRTMVGTTGVEIKNILLENIRNVNKDKSFVPQAAAVNNSVKQLIDLAKAEIEMFKLMANVGCK